MRRETSLDDAIAKYRKANFDVAIQIVMNWNAEVLIPGLIERLVEERDKETQ